MWSRWSHRDQISFPPATPETKTKTKAQALAPSIEETAFFKTLNKRQSVTAVCETGGAMRPALGWPQLTAWRGRQLTHVTGRRSPREPVVSPCRGDGAEGVGTPTRLALGGPSTEAGELLRQRAPETQGPQGSNQHVGVGRIPPASGVEEHGDHSPGRRGAGRDPPPPGRSGTFLFHGGRGKTLGILLPQSWGTAALGETLL